MGRKILVITMAISLGFGILTGCAGVETHVVSQKETEVNGPGRGEEDEKMEILVTPLNSIEIEDGWVENGTYAASFESVDLSNEEGFYFLKADIYDNDRYSREDIDNLVGGDFIEYCGEQTQVVSIDKDKETGTVEINGGFKLSGITLVEEEDEYKTVIEDNKPKYYKAGSVEALLSDTLVFEDAGIILGLEEFVNKKNQYNNNNTQIKVKDGRIIKVSFTD